MEDFLNIIRLLLFGPWWQDTITCWHIILWDRRLADACRHSKQNILTVMVAVRSIDSYSYYERNMRMGMEMESQVEVVLVLLCCVACGVGRRLPERRYLTRGGR